MASEPLSERDRRGTIADQLRRALWLAELKAGREVRDRTGDVEALGQTSRTPR